MNRLKYICKYGLYHDRECENNEPRSNNGWIYTAYAKALGLPVQHQRIAQTVVDCQKTNSIFLMDRLPGKMEPPMSLDEIIGVCSIWPWMTDIILNDWKWYKSDEIKPTLIERIEAVWSLKGKHRNHVWENEIYDAYPVVFSVPYFARFYIRRMTDHIYAPVDFYYGVWFYLYMITTIVKRDHGQMNILWLMLTDMKSKVWIRLINHKKHIRGYFGDEHVFTKVRDERNM